MTKAIVFDIETVYSAADAATPNADKVLAVAVLYDTTTRTNTVIWRDKAAVRAALRKAVAAGYKVVGHNALGFDLEVLGGPAFVEEISEACSDTMEWVTRSEHYTMYTRGAKLEDVAQATLGVGKTKLNGTKAGTLSTMALNGDAAAAELLVKYCTQDVAITAAIYEHGEMLGWVATTDRNGKRYEVKAYC